MPGVVSNPDDDFPYDVPFIPNAYLRLGHPYFHVELGMNDRYMILPDPLYIHGNFGIRTDIVTLRFGLASLGKVGSYLIDFSVRTKYGLTIQPGMIGFPGDDNWGMHLKLSKHIPLKSKI